MPRDAIRWPRNELYSIGTFLIYKPIVSEIAIPIGFKGEGKENCPPFLHAGAEMH